jgi:hypothetical protein
LKGLIFNWQTKKILSITHPVPINFHCLTTEQQKNIINQLTAEANRCNLKIEPIYDGTLMRLAYFPSLEKWLLSTNAKADAYQAKWLSDSSFGTMFDQAMKHIKAQINYDYLDQNQVYLFFLQHPHNVIVIPQKDPQISFVQAYDRTTMLSVNPCSEALIGFPSLPYYEITIDQMQEIIEQEPDMMNCQPVTHDRAGCVVHNQLTDQRIRFESRVYRHARELRGSTNNIDLRLLELKQMRQINQFLGYYPQYKPHRVQLEIRIKQLTTKLTREYKQRYKQRKELWVHHRHHKFLGEIHQLVYKDTLRPIGETVQWININKHLKKQPPKKILYLLDWIYDRESGQPESNG